ncbi:acetolactate synthase large subunit [Roseovarius sp. C7]|uniref:acetolactate synthase large subunit n=1 Tax=Roseovarius sp. C7 TaxID=3398643 RepID=UPI0039F67C27
MVPGGIATLVLPTDLAWGPGPLPLTAPPPVAALDPVADEVVTHAAEIIDRGEPVLIFATGTALSEAGTRALGRLGSRANVEFLAPVNGARYDRGAGRVDIARIPYDPDIARARIAHVKHILLVGTDEPASFFAYPDKPGSVVPDGCTLHRFSAPGDDAVAGLEALADRLGIGPSAYRLTDYVETARPTGAITPASLAAALAATLPENAIICDEGLTQGREVMPATVNTRPHSWVQITGGAIGNGLPLAFGAAMGARDRRVVSVQADGSGLFTLQALWSQAREGLDVTTVILSNQSYAILKGEMANIGVPTPGPLAQDMMSLQNPTIDWLALSKGFGVPSALAEDAETLVRLLEESYATPGPFLIEARIG